MRCSLFKRSLSAGIELTMLTLLSNSRLPTGASCGKSSPNHFIAHVREHAIGEDSELASKGARMSGRPRRICVSHSLNR
jgi:hypothetical protein